jgi:hexokinase
MKNILVVDVGGTNVKVSMSEAKPSLKIPSASP